jgi:hypothetical protein
MKGFVPGEGAKRRSGGHPQDWSKIIQHAKGPSAVFLSLLDKVGQEKFADNIAVTNKMETMFAIFSVYTDTMARSYRIDDQLMDYLFMPLPDYNRSSSNGKDKDNNNNNNNNTACVFCCIKEDEKSLCYLDVDPICREFPNLQMDKVKRIASLMRNANGSSRGMILSKPAGIVDHLGSLVGVAEQVMSVMRNYKPRWTNLMGDVTEESAPAFQPMTTAMYLPTNTIVQHMLTVLDALVCFVFFLNDYPMYHYIY